jgi:hypothetical protein
VGRPYEREENAEHCEMVAEKVKSVIGQRMGFSLSKPGGYQ